MTRELLEACGRSLHAKIAERFLGYEWSFCLGLGLQWYCYMSNSLVLINLLEDGSCRVRLSRDVKMGEEPLEDLLVFQWGDPDFEDALTLELDGLIDGVVK